MKKSKRGCDLKTCFMCNTCLRDWLPAIEANRQNFQYNKGEVIFREGDPVTGIYFVYSGTVKVHKHWGSEKELIIRIAGKGDIVGHRGLGKDLLFPVSATALETVLICHLDLAFFQNTIRVNQEFLYQLMLFFADELKESERKMRNLAHMPVKGRVAQCLLSLQSRFGKDEQGHIHISLSRQDLASFAGTTYETVFRIINEFIQEEAIETNGKSIRILDEEKLRVLTLQG